LQQIGLQKAFQQNYIQGETNYTVISPKTMLNFISIPSPE
jgi:hypothetical protein